MAKDKSEVIEEVVDVPGVTDKLEYFFEKNQKLVLGILGGLILTVAIIVGYQKLIIAPKERAASEIVFHAQNWFQADSFQMALDGDGVNYGFYEIMDDYKGTKIAKAAKFYAGTCELNLSNYDEAIKLFSKFKTKDVNVQSVAYSRLGDAFAQKNDLETAINNYKKAATTATLKSQSGNNYFKAGMAYEVLENNKAAVEMYQKIVDIYPNISDESLNDTDKKLAKVGHINYARLNTIAAN